MTEPAASGNSPLPNPASETLPILTATPAFNTCILMIYGIQNT